MHRSYKYQLFIIIRLRLNFVNSVILISMYNETEILKQFGRNVKAERVRKGHTQESLAEKMNINSEYISKIERGLENMSLKKIVSLTNFLEADLKDILRF